MVSPREANEKGAADITMFTAVVGVKFQKFCGHSGITTAR